MVCVDEVLQPVIAATRGLTYSLQPLKLSNDYFKKASRVARRQAEGAGLQIAYVLSQ